MAKKNIKLSPEKTKNLKNDIYATLSSPNVNDFFENLIRKNSKNDTFEKALCAYIKAGLINPPAIVEQNNPYEDIKKDLLAGVTMQKSRPLFTISLGNNKQLTLDYKTDPDCDKIKEQIARLEEMYNNILKEINETKLNSDNKYALILAQMIFEDDKSNKDDEKEITKFLINRTYIQKTIVTNISSENINCEILMQIPEGSIPVDSDEYKIIEINPRVPASLRAAAISGVNFPEIIVSDAIGQELPKYDYLPGKVLRYMGIDLMWLLKSPRRFTSKPNWMRFLGKDIYYQDIYENDPSTWWTWLVEGLSKFNKRNKKLR